MNLFAFPSKSVISKYYHSRDIVFLSHDGWFVYDKVQSKRILIKYSINDNVLLNLDINDIKNEIYWWYPIYNRWVSNSFKYEDYRVSSQIAIIKVYSGLVEFNIKRVINFTAIPHHIDSLIVSIAASQFNCSQLFLYANVFDGRLIPICHMGNFKNRYILKQSISDVTYLGVISEFVKNKELGNPPKLNTKVLFWKKSFLFSVLYLLWYTTINSISSLLRKRDFNIFNFYKKTSFIDNLSMLLSQRAYLRWFDKAKISLVFSKQLIQDKEITYVILAHYQPEATSFPEGGEWSNHIDIVLKLKSLGIFKIAYKEHPASRLFCDNIVGLTKVGMYRSKSYLSKLIELGCVILDEEVELLLSDSSIKNYFPITITGTIALERSLAGYKTIVVGEPWFKGLPGTYSFEEFNKVKDIVNQKFLEKDEKIAAESLRFLTTILDNNTLSNYLGVGSGRPSYDSLEKENFYASLDLILKSNFL